MQVWDISSALQAAFAGADAAAPPVKALLALPGPSSGVSGMAFSAGGNRLAVGRDDGTVSVWDLPSGSLVQTLLGLKSAVYPLVFTPDGRRLAASSLEYRVGVWELAAPEGQPLLTLNAPVRSSAIAFSPDGRRLAVGLNDGTAKVWDVAAGNESAALRGHTWEIWGIAFSPDGVRLATASNDRTAKVWDAATGEELLTLTGHTSEVNWVVFSPDGARLATAGQDGTARLWDAATGQELLTLPGQGDALAGAAFSQDGARLITVTYEGVIRFYLLRMDDLVTLAGRRVTRSLTAAECIQYLHLPQEQCRPDPEQIAVPSQVVSGSIAAPPVSAKGKVCQVTDEQGVNDQFFNQIAYAGVQEAASKFGWQSAVLESEQPADYRTNVDELLQSGCDLIIAMVENFGDIFKEAALAHPEQKFLIIEWIYNIPLENMWQQVYATDQGAFLAGYAASAASRTGKVGTFGGFNVPPVADFMNGFALGVAYYNEKNGANVQLLGWDVATQDGLFTGNFVNTNDGHRMAEMLMDEGADIILPVAGNVGLGAASAVKERGSGFSIIGVDTDWTVTYPEFAGVIFTSIEKRLDASVVSAVQAIAEGTFTGDVHIGTLENGGVGIAPFHDLDALVSPQVKAELEQIKAGIIAGEIQTRPDE